MPSTGITLGRELAPAAFGFDRPTSSLGAPVAYDGEAPNTVIAPTGSGKGRDVLVPLLLTNPGPAIVVDIKGELSAICGRRRAEMGNRVAVIDPFGITGRPTDRINPLDLFALPGSQVDCDAEMIASQLGSGHEFASDPFWSDTSTALIAGLVAYAASFHAVPTSLDTVRKLMGSDDVDYSLATLLDTVGKNISPFARREIAAYLQISSDKTRPSVLSTARTYMKSLNSESVAACLENSTIDLGDVVAGAPLDIFIVIPPEKMISHAGFLRVVVGTLLSAIMRRTRIPERRTLMVVDEAAHLGKEFGPFLTATTLLRGYGLQLVSAWQDVAQIKGRYKHDWQTILNNSGAVMTFGAGHHAAAKDAAEFLGMDPAALLAMGPDEAVVAIRGQPARKIGRVSYLEDARLAALADPNPFYAPAPTTDPGTTGAPQLQGWRDKLREARGTIARTIEGEDSSAMDPERIQRAILQVLDVIEQVGRMVEASPPAKPKRARRRKGNDLEV